jgi:tetratricopeptide (TPR) repeat protein
MRHIAFLLIAAGLGSSAVAASAEDAQPTRAWTNCQGGPGIWSDLRLTACTEIIKSAKYSGAELAKLHYYRGNARLMQSDYRKAIDDFNAALELSKNDPDALHERCWAKAVLNTDLEGALADCNEALRLRPNDPETLGGRGFLYLRLGFLKTSILDYDAAIEGMPNKADFHYGRATAKYRAGDQDGADSDFLTARALDPKIDETFARIEAAGGGKGMWTTIADYWRSMMKWIY